MGHVSIRNAETGEVREFPDTDPKGAFRRWVEDRARLGAVCAQPGTPGSSPACLTCTASCSSEPADVDPEEPPADDFFCDTDEGIRATDAARMAQWDLDRTEGDR